MGMPWTPKIRVFLKKFPALPKKVARSEGHLICRNQLHFRLNYTFTHFLPPIRVVEVEKREYKYTAEVGALKT